VNRATSDRFNSGTNQEDLTTGNAVWETAPLVFEKLNDDFGPFDLDLTADRQRHLHPVWFGPDSPVDQLDALTADWINFGSNGYSNPPYGLWVQRLLAIAQTHSSKGFASTILLPMRVTKAFKRYVLHGASELLFCDRRLTFFEDGVPRMNEEAWKKGKLRADPAMFDSILVRYLPGASPETCPKLDVWHVPNHVTQADLERARDRRLAVSGAPTVLGE
jgi:hypothetical protein